MIPALIKTHIPVLKLHDKLADAENLVMSAALRGLPVVEKGKLHGVILEREFTAYDKALSGKKEKTIASLFPRPPITIQTTAHLYDAIRIFGLTDETTGQRFIPVIDREYNYQGCVLKDDMLIEVSRILSVGERGIVMEVEVDISSYRIADLVSIIEQNDAHILSLATHPSQEDDTKQLITLQIETTEAFRLQLSLEHHGYDITYVTPTDHAILDDAQRRASEFIRYLET